MNLKQLWCKLRYKHPGRQYATINQIEQAFKVGATIITERCRRCGKGLRTYTPSKSNV